MRTFYTRYFIAVISIAIMIFLLLESCGNQDAGRSAIINKTEKKELQPEPEAPAKTLTAEFKGDEELARIMKKMQDDFDNLSLTGNYDMDLVKMMSIHHHAAIDMIGLQLRNGKNEKLKEANEDLLKSEKKEMADLLSILRDLRLKQTDVEDSTTSEEDKKLSASLFIAMNNMIDTMQMTSSSGDLDKDFIALMSAYQKGVLNVSKLASKSAKHPKIKKMTLQIADDKKEELKKFEQWQKNYNKEVARLDN